MEEAGVLVILDYYGAYRSPQVSWTEQALYSGSIGDSALSNRIENKSEAVFKRNDTLDSWADWNDVSLGILGSLPLVSQGYSRSSTGIVYRPPPQLMRVILWTEAPSWGPTGLCHLNLFLPESARIHRYCAWFSVGSGWRMCVYVCSNANPLHYYVFQILRRADIWLECDLFSNHAPLGQTTWHVGRVSV